MRARDRIRPADTAVTPAGQFRLTLVLAASFLVLVSGLYPLLRGFSWWLPLVLLSWLVLGGAAAARALARRFARSVAVQRLMPSLVGGAVLLGLLTAFFASDTAAGVVVPLLGTWGRFGELIASGNASIAAQSIPANLTPGILFLLCLGVGALALAADLIAITLRFPALSGVPLLVLLAVPAAVDIQLVDAFVFALAAVTYLFLLRSGQPASPPGTAIAVGAVAVASALILPIVLPPVAVTEAASERWGGLAAGVNPVLTLGADLRRQLPRTVLTSSSSTGKADYLRLVSLQNFTADTWAPDELEVDTDNRPNDLGPPPGLSPDVNTEELTTWIDVANLGSPWLPVPYPATAVIGLSGRWYWDAAALTLASPDGQARGEKYRVNSLQVQPTPTQLINAGTTIPDGFDAYLELPEDMPSIISDTARRVASAGSNYEKALALQKFFRDGEFGYSETAPVEQGYDGTGMDVLAQFLQVKTGYCVHFASAMAVMARTLGIPSRVAIGFLPGRQQDELVQSRVSYRVTTRELHSWPELFFDGVGWIRFEPTPGRGFVPVYADEAVSGVPTPPPPLATAPPVAPTAQPTPTATARPIVDPDERGSAKSGAGVTLAVWAMLGLAAGLVMLLMPAIVRMLQRRVRLRRFARGHPIAGTAWREVLQAAQDLGIAIDPAATPREAAAVLAGTIDTARVADVGSASQAGIATVLDRVERESFSRRTTGVPADAASNARAGAATAATETVSAAVVRLLRDLRNRSRPAARLHAVFAPRSVWGALRAMLANVRA